MGVGARGLGVGVRLSAFDVEHVEQVRPLAIRNAHSAG